MPDSGGKKPLGEEEMELMAECEWLERKMLPYKEYVAALNRLMEKWLETHDKMPNWW